MKIKIKHTSKLKDLERTLYKLSGSQVVIGIPEGKASRDDGSGINNATIGHLNEFGSERMHIPPRPHLIPGVKAASPKLTEIMSKFLKKKMQLKDGDYEKCLTACGLVAVASVKNLLQEGLKPKLAPSTIKARARKTKGDHSGDLPLIDTGNYMNHITFTVLKK